MPARRVTLYRRDGCPLCDHAMEMLAPLSRRMGFEIDEVDIERDDALHRRYVYEIPVVAIDGEDVLGWPFTAESLEAGLRGAMGR